MCIQVTTKRRRKLWLRTCFGWEVCIISQLFSKCTILLWPRISRMHGTNPRRSAEVNSNLEPLRMYSFICANVKCCNCTSQVTTRLTLSKFLAFLRLAEALVIHFDSINPGYRVRTYCWLTSFGTYQGGFDKTPLLLRLAFYNNTSEYHLQPFLLTQAEYTFCKHHLTSRVFPVFLRS